MFSQSKQLAAAFAAVVSQSEQPLPGTIIRGLHGLPIRVHCQIKKSAVEREANDSAPPEIFAYATIVPLRPGLAATSGVKHYAQDFGSQDFHGTKAVLLSNSRVKVLRAAAEDDVLRSSDVLPVMALKVVTASASGRALKVEVAEYCSADVLERCAGLVLAFRRLEELKEAAASVGQVNEADQYAQATLSDFYASFEEDRKEAAAAAAVAVAAAVPAAVPAEVAPAPVDSEVPAAQEAVPAADTEEVSAA